MLIKEYRIILPFTLEEYRVGQLYSIAEMSKSETGGGEGVEVLKNEPCDDAAHGKGQYTHKIYHLSSKVPRVIRTLAPKGSLEIHEHSWNCYPHYKTVLSNPDYMKDGFHITIETMHIADDKGTTENALNLPPELLAKREVIYVDMVNDPIQPNDYKQDQDPSLYRCERANRGPLAKDWKESPAHPFMCAYKLVTCEFKWFGLQGTVEGRIQKVYPRLFRNLHRQIFCCMDKWYGLTMDDIRRIEEETKAELDRQRLNEPARGTREE